MGHSGGQQGDDDVGVQPRSQQGEEQRDGGPGCRDTRSTRAAPPGEALRLYMSTEPR